MRNIQIISNTITKNTQNHILVKGKKSVHSRIVSTMADELREFLAAKKAQEIHPDEVTGFFSFYFPKLDAEVKAAKNRDTAGQLIQTFDNYGKVKSFTITIPPTKYLPQIHGHPRIRVNAETTEALVHEGSHLIQSAIKSELQIHKAKIKKLVPKEAIPPIEYSLKFIFHKYIYFNAEDSYIRPVFSAQINQLLENLSNGNKKLHLEFLRMLIRQAEMEKQAFELGKYENKMFNSPILKRFKWYQNTVRDKVTQKLESDKHLGDKIAALKEDYFSLAKKIHDERLAKSAKNN